MTKSSYKTRYIIFILTVVVTIIANEAILRYNLSLQDSDAKIVNIAGRQRMLSQRIVKNLLFFVDDRVIADRRGTEDSLRVLLKEFEDANKFLISKEPPISDNTNIKSLLESIQTDISTITEYSREAIKSTDSLTTLNALRSVVKVEPLFLNKMEAIVREYQEIAETKLANTKRTALLLSILSIVVLLGEFLFIIAPFFNDLFRKNKALKLANRKLSDFAHITSHNLRAPLSNMNSLLHFYKESEDPEDKEDLMDKFETVISNMNQTMNVLVEALKVNAETAEEMETLSFQKILERTKESISNIIAENDVEIISDFKEAPTISYHRLYLESIFLNLLTNAIRYRSTERDPVIKIKSFRKQGKTVVSFEDNGLGINMERHGEKLFGLNKTFHRHPDSKGVGLFMTRNQIESLGGEISAVSTEGEGTTFTIIF